MLDNPIIAFTIIILRRLNCNDNFRRSYRKSLNKSQKGKRNVSHQQNMISRNNYREFSNLFFSFVNKISEPTNFKQLKHEKTII